MMIAYNTKIYYIKPCFTFIGEIIKLFLVLICVLLVSCDEMETVLTTGSVYKVSAQVGNSDIDNSTIVTSKDPISPYFISSIAKDPDIRALTVFLQDRLGQVVMDKIQYKLVQDSTEEPVQDSDEGLVQKEEGERLENFTLQYRLHCQHTG